MPLSGPYQRFVHVLFVAPLDRQTYESRIWIYLNGQSNLFMHPLQLPLRILVVVLALCCYRLLLLYMRACMLRYCSRAAVPNVAFP